MKERTTRELIETLGNDVDRCYNSLIQAIDEGETESDGSVLADYEYYARQLIRAILAYIEGIIFSVKVKSVERCLAAGIKVSDHERYLAVEVDSDLNDKGEVIERSPKLRLANNIRFAFRLLEKSSGQPSKFDPSLEWWSCLQETVRVRDRLTHPRMPEDLDVSGNDIIKALKAKAGFDEVLFTTKLKSGKKARSIQATPKLTHSTSASKKRTPRRGDN